MKNSPSPLCSSKGFVLVTLLILAPVLAALLALVYRIVLLVEFRSEFRFKCITESLALNRELSHSHSNGKLSAAELLFRLQKIETPLKYYVTLTDYPEFESETPENATQTLAYRLNYSVLPGEPAVNELSCGIRLRKAENKWQYESIYKIKKDKF